MLSPIQFTGRKRDCNERNGGAHFLGAPQLHPHQHCADYPQKSGRGFARGAHPQRYWCRSATSGTIRTIRTAHRVGMEDTSAAFGVERSREFCKERRDFPQNVALLRDEQVVTGMRPTEHAGLWDWAAATVSCEKSSRPSSAMSQTATSPGTCTIVRRVPPGVTARTARLGLPIRSPRTRRAPGKHSRHAKRSSP